MSDKSNSRQALSITLTIPIKCRRITNGEKVIWPTGPDECEVEIVDDTGDACARLQELLRILGDADRSIASGGK
jgi:hypothetical protein